MCCSGSMWPTHLPLNVYVCACVREMEVVEWCDHLTDMVSLADKLDWPLPPSACLYAFVAGWAAMYPRNWVHHHHDTVVRRRSRVQTPAGSIEDGGRMNARVYQRTHSAYMLYSSFPIVADAQLTATAERRANENKWEKGRWRTARM